MAARDRYTWNVTCPKCQNKGVLHISEEDYPFMKSLGRAIDKIEGDFAADIEGDSKVRVTCTRCKYQFVD